MAIARAVQRQKSPDISDRVSVGIRDPQCTEALLRALDWPLERLQGGSISSKNLKNATILTYRVQEARILLPYDGYVS
jgi:hypothetical protein